MVVVGEEYSLNHRRHWNSLGSLKSPTVGLSSLKPPKSNKFFSSLKSIAVTDVVPTSLNTRGY